MITVTPTTDMALVKDIFTDESVWDGVSDDGSVSPDEWEPNPAVTYLAVNDGETICGVAMLVPQNTVMLELHSAMLAAHRGHKTVEAAKQMQEWVWANTPAQKIMTWVPAYNRPARVGAIRAGFAMEGLLRAAYLKNNELHDLYLYGVSRCPPPSHT